MKTVFRSTLLSSHVQGALWKTLSCLCFASINGVVRYLSTQPGSGLTLPSSEIAFFQNLFGFFVLLPWFLKHRPHDNPWEQWISRNIPLHLWRVLASATGLVLFYTALGCMPIAQAVSLGFLGPIITTLGARFALREPLGIARLAAIGLGVMGGLCISHSGYLSGHDAWQQVSLVCLIPIASAIAFSASTLIAKRLTVYDSPHLITLYLMALMIPVLGLLALRDWVAPTWTQVVYLGALGVLAATAHLSMVKSFACADVTFLIPFGATRLVASALIGLIWFCEIPSRWTLIGSILILTGIVLLGRAEARKPAYAS